ncbi:MAG: DUF547 domain-containing protein [Candidatus Binatia bacterium]
MRHFRPPVSPSGPLRLLKTGALALALAASFVSAGTAFGQSAACPAFDHHHPSWTLFLDRYVQNGVVDYERIHGDESLLTSYLAELRTVCADDHALWTRNQKLAFWINAYNAFTIRLILDHYPIDSIRSIGFLPGAAFRKAFIQLPNLRDGWISLQTIEDDILRAEFEEPRIHFAIVCASKSCPALASNAYTADALDFQLDRSARTFLADSTKNRWDASTRTFLLSSIFQWFRSDFEKPAGTLKQFLQRYVDPKISPEIGTDDVQLQFLAYDWSLNGK